MKTFKIEDIAQDGGGLDSFRSAQNCGYISWLPREDKCCIDGYYTADDLRALADWMEKHKEAKP